MAEHTSYGVIEREEVCTELKFHQEKLLRNGFTVLNSGLTETEIEKIREDVINLKASYEKKYGMKYLKSIGEQDVLRAPLLVSSSFLKVCLNDNVLKLVSLVMNNNYILNQQNVIINPCIGNDYSQSLWHRDLPYQHFVSSRPLAVNAIFCLDDFTKSNGGTWVIPYSHKQEVYPSDPYIHENEVQVEAKIGQFILIDSMLYHKGGDNLTSTSRVGINNVYSSPIIRRQIDYSESDFEYDFRKFFEKNRLEKLGLKFHSHKTIESYLSGR